MYNNLYKLFKRDDSQEKKNKTLLEDFNTESFVGLLKGNEDLKTAFLYTFLKLSNDKYSINTQISKNISNTHQEYSDCRIDIVLEGKDNIVFIECKVNSQEGYKQLERYQVALETHYPNKTKTLLYITKNYAPKNILNYNFKQYRWYEIADFLIHYTTRNYYINEYILFLKEQKMTQDTKLLLENINALKVLQKTVEIGLTYIENSKQDFETRFGKTKGNSNQNWGEIKRSNRFCNLTENILKGDGYSEMLYSIEFETVELSTHLFIERNHSLYKQFINIEYPKELTLIEIDTGASLYIKDQLDSYLEKDDSITLIKEWYLKSFDLFKNYLDKSNISILNELDNKS
ncbi:PD-(D/E)XK nuclease family protein [Myroides sp. 1354]|uniref:PD-(D/E)XK nuclease family protein n=1 Tax=unclassified Myroides TaxID=2642485 RepID=UPI0025773485|nr:MULTISPECIES: PD-(D/E)XK nuclease family protein [unclassified Myroides]MDM1046484.1 PD-(D/E)XK nuclease family protein [Myroides sp. R163-1]MDM1057393.1 PD-(D/E)XK nuclease family protein [Myroides sp. 1354]MDM1070678.1 PD-(D/E)XK nuclease family protein [Myroides sp. 1372]